MLTVQYIIFVFYAATNFHAYDYAAKSAAKNATI